ALRVERILQRSRQMPEIPAPTSQTIAFGPYSFDPVRKNLLRSGDNRSRAQESETVHLTSSESDLLAILAQNFNQPVSREALLEQTDISGNDRTVDVQINRLRSKIEIDPKKPVYIQTVRHRGYVLRG